MEPRPLTATLAVDASPAAVWAVISDLRRTGEWSPECQRVTPLGRLLLGRNRRGHVRWVTLSWITERTTERAVEWTVLTNRSRWRYELSPTPVGTLITETRRTPRGEGRFALWFTGRFLGGQGPHDDELEQGMARGLERIAALSQV